ncbi:hypothetical protein [Exiguobacterium alkaliphilum]|uniref:hypothetical protein n=1 Tax=Exiguobacterium alkaliphilum TaxID=1428684 RepID=UPI001BADC5E5|nr:hypothetical protein [Exiguobacterium alkaliphilum]QUE85899.1 hypothetical protein KB235_12175 [Exiguobacterium alkaliphilum]
MKQDERGYVLILVLVTMAALAVLSLAAIQVNLAANKQTVFRVNETQLDTDVKSVLNVLVADVRKTFPKHDPDTVEDYMKTQTAFQSRVETLLALNQLYTGSRQSDENEIRYTISRSVTDRIDAPFTTVLTLTATGTTKPKPEQPTQTATYSQDVYLTALPSFLYYVLGTDDMLTINGPPSISGNMYAGKQLDLNRDANYQLGSSKKTLSNSPTSRFYTDGKIDLGDTAECSGCDAPNYFATSTTPGASDRPDIGQVESSFSKFNFDYSIVQYVNRHVTAAPYIAYGAPEASIFGSGRFNVPTTPPFITQTYTVPGQTEPITRWTEFIDRQRLDAITDLRRIQAPTTSNNPIIISESIARSTVPLLFDGDVVIEGTRDITISRPLIVNGNLTIRGKVAFDTTVYALKDAFIDRAEIRGVSSAQDSSLVLLAKGKVLLNRIDEFSDTSSPLQAFLYSDSEQPTRVFAVGSIVNIRGGLYSKGPLEINTFRGTFQPLPAGSPKEAYFASSNVTPSDEFAKSRLVMEYNEGVFEQINTLPVTNQLQLFVSQPVKQ